MSRTSLGDRGQARSGPLAAASLTADCALDRCDRANGQVR